jgi:hypothetical protein
MSDVQTTNDSAQARDNGLNARRVVAFVLAFGIGLLLTEVFEVAVLKVPAFTASFPIAFLPEVHLWYTAGSSLGFFFLIWIDYFMGTGILPD